MKVELVTDIEIPGGFVIRAETPEECLILRMFVNDKRKIHITNSGGNIGENRYSLMICHCAEWSNAACGAVEVEQ
jgi:hypothetical protein